MTIVTKPELARHIKVSPRTIDNWIAAKRIPVLRLGRSIRFNLANVEAALNRFEVKEAK